MILVDFAVMDGMLLGTIFLRRTSQLLALSKLQRLKLTCTSFCLATAVKALNTLTTSSYRLIGLVQTPQLWLTSPKILWVAQPPISSFFFIRALSVKRNQLSSSMLGLLLLGRVRCPRIVKKLFKGALFCDGNAADPAAEPGVYSPSLAWKSDFVCLEQGTRFHIRMMTLAQCVAQTIDRLAYDAVIT